MFVINNNFPASCWRHLSASLGPDTSKSSSITTSPSFASLAFPYVSISPPPLSPSSLLLPPPHNARSLYKVHSSKHFVNHSLTQGYQFNLIPPSIYDPTSTSTLLRSNTNIKFPFLSLNDIHHCRQHEQIPTNPDTFYSMAFVTAWSIIPRSQARHFLYT